MNPTHSMMQSSKGVSNGPIGGEREMVENNTVNFRKNLLKTNNLYDNTTRRRNIITQNWQQYLPTEIYDIMFPVKKKKEKEQIKVEVEEEEEIKRKTRERKIAEQIAKRTAGTKEWYAEYFPGKLWPEHPLSQELSLKWGLVQITNSLHIQGFDNNGELLEKVTAFKKSCGKKSSGGGQFRKRSKNIVRRPCTGFSEVNLDEIKNWFDQYKKSDSDSEFYLPAAFINSSVDSENKKEYKLFHVVPKEDFPLYKALGVLGNEMKNCCVAKKDDLENGDNYGITFVRTSDDEIMDLTGLDVNDDQRDTIDVNHLDPITRQACLVKAKIRQSNNIKEAKKAKKNQERAAKMKLDVIEDNELIDINHNITGELIGYYDKYGNILDLDEQLVVGANYMPVTYDEFIESINISDNMIDSYESNLKDSSAKSSESSNESDKETILEGITFDENCIRKENTHNVKGRFEAKKSAKKKTARRSNKEIDDDFDAL